MILTEELTLSRAASQAWDFLGSCRCLDHAGANQAPKGEIGTLPADERGLRCSHVPGAEGNLKRPHGWRRNSEVFFISAQESK